MEAPKKGRAGRVAARAEKTMGKAQKTFMKAEATRATAKSSKNLTVGDYSNAELKADRLYGKSQRQETRAKTKMEKAKYIAAKNAKPVPGMVGKTVKKGK